MRIRRTLCVGVLTMLAAHPGWADTCPTAITNFLQNKTTGTLTCFHAADLRTTVPPAAPVTPPDNSIFTFANGVTPLPGLFAGFGSITPDTDLTVISNGPALVPTPINGAVAGWEVYGWYADDPQGEARFLLRLPDTWNGKLVVAGASGTRSEFNGDWAWSDYVLQEGYAYASQNKGVLNLFLLSLTDPFYINEPEADPLGCRGSPTSSLWVHFYDNDPGKEFTQWTRYMIETARLAQGTVDALYGRRASKTYAVGTSNGGYQVRRAVEEAPEVFDGGVDWEGTFIDPRKNILVDLPPAIKNFPAYVASNFDPNSQAARNIVAAGYPPDIVTRDSNGNEVASLWGNYSDHFWEVTMCQWQKRFDPAFDTFGDLHANPAGNLPNYNYAVRARTPHVVRNVAETATTGRIKRPLVTVAGTMDALLPIENQAREYERLVKEQDGGRGRGDGDHDKRAYRLYEVQNGNHIEAYVCTTAPCATGTSGSFPQLQTIQPHAQKAFELLVDFVEHGAELPPSQCIPRGGQISEHPNHGESGHCKNLFVP
jgi:3HB-oligomer hydrolase (3HBOH)